MSPRNHPPTLAGVTAALVGSLGQDLTPLVRESFLSETTLSLTTTIAAGVLGGAIGWVTERWTVPFRYEASDGPDQVERQGE